jgi:hypothetical protein
MTTEFSRALDFLISLNLQNQMAVLTQETFISKNSGVKSLPLFDVISDDGLGKHTI